MPLLKNGQAVADIWVKVADDDPLPENGPILISYGRWEAERESLIHRNTPIGIILPNTVDVLAFGPTSNRFGVIVLQFPKFSDGRAYSQARLLRQRFGYRGELRAAGAVLRDQLRLMHRCGFDAIEFDHPDAAQVFAAALQEFGAAYQPAADRTATALQQRLSRLRKAEAAE